MFTFFRRLSFQSKLQTAVIGIVLCAILITSGYSVYNIYRASVDLGKDLLVNMVDQVENALTIHHKNVNSLLNAGMDNLQLMVGTGDFDASAFKDQQIVDRLRKQYDITASIYALEGNDFVAVSTNAMQGDKRLVGIKLDDAKVAADLKQGKSVQGAGTVGGVFRIYDYVPVVRQGKVVGALFTGKRVLTDILTEYLQESSLAGKGYPFIYDAATGAILYHPLPEAMGKHFDKAYDFGRSLMDAKDGFFAYQYKGESKVTAQRLYKDFGWRLAFGMTEDEMLHGMDTEILRSALIGGGIALVLSFLSLMVVIAKVLVAPVKGIAQASEQIAAGDYQVSIDYPASDAIGDTVHAVHSLASTIKEKLGFIQGVLAAIKSPNVIADAQGKVLLVNQEMLDFLEIKGAPEAWIGKSAGALIFNDVNRKAIIEKAMAEEKAYIGTLMDVATRSGSMRHVRVDSVPIYDLDNKLIGGCSIWTDMTEIKRAHDESLENQGRLLELAAEIDDFTQHLAAGSVQLAAQIEEASQGSQQQRDRTTSTATAMEEMNATVIEVARYASEAVAGAQGVQQKSDEGSAVVGSVIKAMAKVGAVTEELREESTRLGSQAQDIKSIITVIQDIADQTNLLALNAAIEAARAGDAGRGFAVVADEVRKLAERTMVATKEVSESINAINSSVGRNISSVQEAAKAVEESNMLAKQAGDSLQEILTIAHKAGDQITSIATAAEQQSATSEEINRSVDEISVIATEVATGMDESAQAVTNMSSQVDALKELVQRLRQAGTGENSGEERSSPRRKALAA